MPAVSVIVPSKTTGKSLNLHKFDLSIVVENLIAFNYHEL